VIIRQYYYTCKLSGVGKGGVLGVKPPHWVLGEIFLRYIEENGYSVSKMNNRMSSNTEILLKKVDIDVKFGQNFEFRIFST